MSTWDDKPNDYEQALWALEQFKNNQDVMIHAVHEATIEECARVVEGIRARTVDYAIAQAAAAIRALKDRP